MLPPVSSAQSASANATNFSSVGRSDSQTAAITLMDTETAPQSFWGRGSRIVSVPCSPAQSGLTMPGDCATRPARMTLYTTQAPLKRYSVRVNSPAVNQTANVKRRKHAHGLDTSNIAYLSRAAPVVADRPEDELLIQC